MNAHQIDYEIFGEEMQFVEIELDAYEAFICRRLADRVLRASRNYGAGSKEEGSVLGGLGKLLDGNGW